MFSAMLSTLRDLYHNEIIDLSITYVDSAEGVNVNYFTVKAQGKGGL